MPGIITQTAFFNFSTGQAEEPNPLQYCFNYIDHPFQVKEPLDPEVVNFFRSLCNYDNLQLHVLRHFFKCTLLGKNLSQMILFMMGPGQTGKSTFAKMLMSILKKTSCTLELNRLSGRFETSRIMGKQLLVLRDVDPYGLTSKRASLVKLLSSQEPIVRERKHQDTVNFVFKGNILIHGNSFFENPERGPKDSTGLARRIVKFPCNTVAAQPNSQLPELLERNQVSLIWWALNAELRPDDFLGKIPLLNEVLDEDVEDEMRGFILEKICVNKEAVTALGGQEFSPQDSLYASYKAYCLSREYEICGWSNFCNQFLTTLRSLRVGTSKVRRKEGQFIRGVSLRGLRPIGYRAIC